MTWSRFKEFYYQDEALGIALDISRIPFPDAFLASMEPPHKAILVPISGYCRRSRSQGVA